MAAADIEAVEWCRHQRHSLMLVLLNGGNHNFSLAQEKPRHSLMLVLLNGGPLLLYTSLFLGAPLADACVTEWRVNFSLPATSAPAAPLADACVTEWRKTAALKPRPKQSAPLADACVTEWRITVFLPPRMLLAPLADACVTEWR